MTESGPKYYTTIYAEGEDGWIACRKGGTLSDAGNDSDDCSAIFDCTVCGPAGHILELPE